MATAAETGDVVMVEARTGPGVGGMAGVALASGLDMSRWFAGRDSAVMATTACPGDATVIEAGAQPGGRVVTVVACSRGLYMAGWFAGSG